VAPQTDDAVSQPRAVEAISEPRAVEPISQPRAVEPISDQPVSVDDLGSDEPTDAELEEVHAIIQAFRRAQGMTDDEASVAVVPPGKSPEDEKWEQRRKERQERLERLDQEQKAQREEQARRYETFLERNPDRPDSGGRDMVSDGEAGRPPPAEAAD
jgi:hypothetical protein